MLAINTRKHQRRLWSLNPYLLIGLLLGCTQDKPQWQPLITEIQQRYSQVEHISIDTYIEHYQGDAILIDVREADEFAVSHIPGAINLTNPAKILALAGETGKPVVVYCSVGYRSAAIADQLLNANNVQVMNMQGSIF